MQRHKTDKFEGAPADLPETSSMEIQSEPMTPRKKVNSEIRKAGVSPRVIPKPIKNQLLFANVISEEIKEASKNSTSKL